MKRASTPDVVDMHHRPILEGACCRGFDHVCTMYEWFLRCKEKPADGCTRLATGLDDLLLEYTAAPCSRQAQQIRWRCFTAAE